MLLFLSSSFERWREKIALSVQDQRIVVVHVVQLVDVEVKPGRRTRLTVVPAVALKFAALFPVHGPEPRHVVAQPVERLRRQPLHFIFRLSLLFLSLLAGGFGLRRCNKVAAVVWLLRLTHNGILLEFSRLVGLGSLGPPHAGIYERVLFHSKGAICENTAQVVVSVVERVARPDA